jgi:hypothetical protein
MSMLNLDPSLVTGPDNLRSADVLATQTAMDRELADHQPAQPTTLAELAKLLPRLAPPHPQDLAAARHLDGPALASRVGDATSQLLQLPPSLLELQPSAQAAHHHTYTVIARHQQLTRQLQRQGRLRRWLQPQRAIQLRQQLRAVHQDQERAGRQLQQARLRLRAIEVRQDQRHQYLRSYRLELREGAAAALVLAERELARDHDRDTGRRSPGRDQPPPSPQSAPPDTQRPGSQLVRDAPERS